MTMSCVSGCDSTYEWTNGQVAITRRPRRRASAMANRTSPLPTPFPSYSGRTSVWISARRPYLTTYSMEPASSPSIVAS